MRNTWILPVINRIGKRSDVCTIYPLDVPVATFKTLAGNLAINVRMVTRG